MGLRLLQLVVSIAAAFVAFEGIDTLNLPLIIGAAVVGLVTALAVGLILAANRKERRKAGLPRAASATIGVALAFSLLELVGTTGAGAVVWTSDSCTMRMGTQNANITLTGFFSKQVCQNVEGSTQNKVLGVLGDADRVLSQLPVVGRIFGEVGTAPFHDGSPSGDYHLHRLAPSGAMGCCYRARSGHLRHLRQVHVWQPQLGRLIDVSVGPLVWERLDWRLSPHRSRAASALSHMDRFQ